MVFIPPGEKIVEKKICRISGQEFFVTDKDLEFYDKISPAFGGQKYLVPSPTLCPDERMRRRLTFRNERYLYKRTCDATGKEIISNFGPHTACPVFSREYWISDKYDPSSYGRVFDFSRPFFDQFGDFIKTVPQPHLIQGVGNENSHFVHHAGECRNCYYIFDSDFCEKCFYSTKIAHCKDMIDCSFCYHSEHCFSSIQCRQSSNLYYSSYCINCRDSWFISDCIGCQDCLFCTNLKNKQFCFLNKQLTKEEFQMKLDQFMNDQNTAQKKAIFKDFSEKSIKKNFHGLQGENCIGDDCYNVKNIFTSFGMDECEDCRYCDLINTSKNCYDVSSFGEGLNWIYEGCTIGITSSNCLFGHMNVLNATNLIYCDMAILSSKNCFGCVSIKKGEHCILNKPYSAAEYEILCGKIIDHMRSTGEWGEFFPHELSPFGYNETVANEYFPLSPGQGGWYEVPGGLKKGDLLVNWHTEEVKVFEGSPYHPLPISRYDEREVGFDTATQNINEVLGGVIQCEVTGKPFKIIKQELVFYIENSIPIPTKHPDQRHKERMDLRNPRKLYERACMCEECENIARETNTFKEEEFVILPPDKGGTGGFTVSDTQPPKVPADMSPPLSGGRGRRRIMTIYSPERPEKVVCEECYRKLVY